MDNWILRHPPARNNAFSDLKTGFHSSIWSIFKVNIWCPKARGTIDKCKWRAKVPQNPGWELWC